MRSAMQGRIIEVLVAAGESVGAGDELMVIESMKMELPVQAPIAGAVRQVFVSVGDQVLDGTVLMVLE
ncbi:MAG: biotin/lipoyl-containing protein [Tepidiformaceae bacterium]